MPEKTSRLFTDHAPGKAACCRRSIGLGQVRIVVPDETSQTTLQEGRGPYQASLGFPHPDLHAAVAV